MKPLYDANLGCPPKAGQFERDTRLKQLYISCPAKLHGAVPNTVRLKFICL
jgi:hypothetical protein